MMRSDIRNVIAALLLPMVIACFPEALVQEVEPRTADGIFSMAEKNFRVGAYDRALRYYNSYLSGYPNGPYGAKALLREGTIYTQKGRHRTARNIYQYLLEKYPDSDLVPEASHRILETFYNDGEYRNVIRYAEKVLKSVEDPSLTLRTYNLVGDAYLAIGSPINAVYYYAKAGERADPTGARRTEQLEEAVAQLSSEDIAILLERIEEDPLIRGHLLYQLGRNQAEEGLQKASARTLSMFLETYPDHEKAAGVRSLMEGFDVLPYVSRQTIGCLLPLSGSYQLYGNRALRGVELALSRSGRGAGGPSFNIVVKDTGSDPAQARIAIAQLLDEEPSAVIGPIITAEGVIQEAQYRRVPTITLTQKEHVTEIGNFIFRNFITPRMQARAVVRYAMGDLGLRRFAVLYPEEKYGYTFLEKFRQEVHDLGGEVTGMESYGTDQTDFSAPIQRLASAFHRDGGGFEALFIPDAPRKVGLIVPQLVFFDVKGVRLLGTNLWHSDRLIQMAGDPIQGAVLPEGFFAESGSRRVREFVRIFEETFGETPGFIEAIAYDTANILIQVLSRYDIRTRSQLRDALARVRDFPGVTGLTSFETGGEARKELYLLRIEGRNFVEIGAPLFGSARR